MGTKIHATVLCLTALTWAAGAAASADQTYYDKARVIDVDPIVETLEVSRPEEHCWTERIVRPHRGTVESYAGTVAGGVIGGLIGNRFGDGKKSRRAMTIAGSVIGASVGNHLSRPYYGQRVSHERHCEIVDNVDIEEQVVGYRVKYRYKGETFFTRTSSHPGDFIRIRVSVRPTDAY